MEFHVYSLLSEIWKKQVQGELNKSKTTNTLLLSFTKCKSRYNCAWNISILQSNVLDLSVSHIGYAYSKYEKQIWEAKRNVQQTSVDARNGLQECVTVSGRMRVYFYVGGSGLRGRYSDLGSPLSPTSSPLFLGISGISSENWKLFLCRWGVQRSSHLKHYIKKKEKEKKQLSPKRPDDFLWTRPRRLRWRSTTTVLIWKRDIQYKHIHVSPVRSSGDQVGTVFFRRTRRPLEKPPRPVAIITADTSPWRKWIVQDRLLTTVTPLGYYWA